MIFKVKCIDDTKQENCGFLWLFSKPVKDERLTAGKVYDVLGIHSATSGNIYINNTWHYLRIMADTGVEQLFKQEKFELYTEESK